MSTHAPLPHTASLTYLKIHSSTSEHEITDIRAFLVRLIDKIQALFNSNHVFKSLNNKTIPEYNLAMTINDAVKFIQNEDLNNKNKQNTIGHLKYSFKYVAEQARISTNLHNIYSSGDFEPNDMITQLINFVRHEKQTPSYSSHLLSIATTGIKTIKTALQEAKPFIHDGIHDSKKISQITTDFDSLIQKIDNLNISNNQ